MPTSAYTHTRAHTHTMDDIQHVVNKVVEACAQQGVDDVSKILAALVARTTSMKTQTYLQWIKC